MAEADSVPRKSRWLKLFSILAESDFWPILSEPSKVLTEATSHCLQSRTLSQSYCLVRSESEKKIDLAG